jgi:excisionase family DNA binding protein
MIRMDEKLLTVAEVAEHLRVDPRSVYRWIRSGQLEAIDIGREYRISESQLRDFLEQRSTRRRSK